jgi:hypothetical protein
MLDALAAADALENSRFLVDAIQWNENRDRFPDDLVSRIAEKPLRTAVPTGDDAVEVFADDRVIGEFHD